MIYVIPCTMKTHYNWRQVEIFSIDYFIRYYIVVVFNDNNLNKIIRLSQRFPTFNLLQLKRHRGSEISIVPLPK